MADNAAYGSDDRERDFTVVDATLRKACYGPGTPGLTLREHSKAKAALLRLIGRDPAVDDDATGGIADEPCEKLRVALRDILLIESGRNIRHRMDDAQMWQAMTDIARAVLEKTRG